MVDEQRRTVRVGDEVGRLVLAFVEELTDRTEVIDRTVPVAQPETGDAPPGERVEPERHRDVRPPGAFRCPSLRQLVLANLVVVPGRACSDVSHLVQIGQDRQELFAHVRVLQRPRPVALRARHALGGVERGRSEVGEPELHRRLVGIEACPLELVELLIGEPTLRVGEGPRRTDHLELDPLFTRTFRKVGKAELEARADLFF